MERRPSGGLALLFALAAGLILGLTAIIRMSPVPAPVAGSPGVALTMVQSASAGNPTATSLAPAQATATETLAPTEIPPTPEAPPGTTEPSDRCLTGVPSPRFFWTLYVAPRLASGATGMWVPMGDNGGPYLKAYVKALYGDVWYGATLSAADGRIQPDPFPPWPRPDLIRSASVGVQTTRGGNPMCGRSAVTTLPPCYAELVVPLVFLDRLAPGGPYLRNAYFWLPSDQVEDDGGRPSRVTAQEYSPDTCDTRQVGSRLARARPVYAMFSGCSEASRRIDTCYLAGCGDLWLHCQ
jgi:hypothetical protein